MTGMKNNEDTLTGGGSSGIFGLVPHGERLRFEPWHQGDDNSGERTERTALDDFRLFQTVDEFAGVCGQLTDRAPGYRHIAEYASN